MVKRKPRLSFALVVVCVLAAGGCAVRGPVVRVAAESLALNSGAAAPFLSLSYSAGMLYAVFADRATTTLDIVEIPHGPHLPSSPPVPEIIDKVDVVAPLSATFGESLLSTGNDRMGVLYLDRESDVKSVLKLATRSPGEKQWSLEILEPAGDPLALDPDASGGFAAAWSSGLLSYRSASGHSAVGSTPLPFKSQGRGSPDGSRGFTAFDALSSQLFSLSWTGSGYTAQIVPRGSPVHASLRSSAGKLSILSWDMKARRLLLHQRGSPGDPFSTATVTVCDGTSSVALLPAESDDAFLMLFDEVRSIGAGRIISQVSLIAPGSVLGARGTRYRKAILASGDARIDGFAAARTSDSLYVLVSQGAVKLIRIPLAQ